MIAQQVALQAPQRVEALIVSSSRIIGGLWNSLPTWTGLYRFLRMRMASDGNDELNKTLEWYCCTLRCTAHRFSAQAVR